MHLPKVFYNLNHINLFTQLIFFKISKEQQRQNIDRRRMLILVRGVNYSVVFFKALFLNSSYLTFTARILFD